jgi:hypothetical protein
MRQPLMRCIAVGLAAVALAGCVSETRYVATYPPPPPVPAETIPKPPVSEDPLIWQPGHWDWSGSQYTWQQGMWIKREGHGTQWQDGYWSNTGGTSKWVPAHWL